MKKTILTAALSASILCGYAQVYPTVTWTKTQGGSGAEVNYGITTDAAGNVYTLGLFNGTADLDPGSGTFNVTSVGSADIYVSKLDANGNFVWGKAVGGTSFETPAGIAVDASGNVIVCGSYASTVDFDPGSGTFNLTSAGSSDGFVLKLDATGNFAWASSIGSTLNEAVNAVGTDASGNVYAAGYFTGTIDFDPGPGTSNMTSNGGEDAFAVKYTSSGGFTWSRKLGTNGGDRFNAIDVRANGYAYLAGYYGGTIAGGDMNPVNPFPISCQGVFDGVMWQLTAAGVGDGGAVMGGAGDEQFTAVAVDELNSGLFIAGHYSGTISAPYSLTNNGSTDVCLMRFRMGSNNSITSVLFSHGIGNAQAQYARSLDVDASGNVYMGGVMNGTNIVDFDPAVTTNFVTGAGIDDGFVASYDSTGVNRFAFNIGNASTDFVSNTISVRNTSIFVGGGYSGTLDFDPTFGTSNMTPNGSYDGYAAKYNFCVAPATPTNTTPVPNRTICAGNSATLTATGAGNGHISWYSAANGGTYLGSGSPFTTAPLTSTTTFYIQDSTCTASNNRDFVTVTVNPAPVMATGSSPDPATVCAGQQVTLVATGGTISWSGGVSNYVPFTPTATTTYTATATGTNGCTSTATVLVTVNPAPAVTITSNPSGGAVCQGDSITLTGNGATSYTWSGGISNGVAFTPSSSGTYTVTGTDANGCTNTATINVTVNTNPTITISSFPATPTICIGDTIYLTGNGANAMTWSGGVSDGDPFTPTATGTYTVTGTDGNGCSGTASITVTVNALPTVTASSLPANGTVCAGSGVTLNGGGATSYTWSGGATNGVSFVPASSGTYTVTGTDANGCSNTATTTITINSLPAVTATTSLDTVCSTFTQPVTLTGGGAGTYTWSGGVTNGVPFVPTSTTTYTVTGTDGNGCADTASVTVYVEVCNGIASGEPENAISLYPNPNNGMFTVASPGQGVLTIFDITGKEVYSQQLGKGNTSVTLNEQPKGMYVVRLVCGDNMLVKRIIVK